VITLSSRGEAGPRGGHPEGILIERMDCRVRRQGENRTAALKRNTVELFRGNVQFTEMAIKEACLNHIRKAHGEGPHREAEAVPA